MITNFDSSYVGTVDMENCGYLGTPINDRRYSSEELAGALHKAVAYAKTMDGLGYNTFWMAEHHFQPEGTECIPNLLMMAMHLVHLTKNLKIGCGFNVVPMWHPLRLAEDYAMADILSGGRVIFGVARGYHTREVESFGAPLIDQDANRELFEEGVDIVFKAFNEERFSHKGRFYTIPPEVPYRGYTLKDITLVPRPERLPVECWQPIQSGSDRAFDFMAKHGIRGVIGGGSAEGGAVQRHMDGFRAAYARRGIELQPGERLSLGYQFFIAESREAAMAQAGKYYEENMKMFGELRLVRAITEAQIAAMRDPRLVPNTKLPRIEDAVQAGGFLAGTPADIIEALKAVEKRFPGLNRVSCSLALGTPLSLALEQLERFAKDVMPAFKGAMAQAAE
ncbi:LLM class flavin-dependent oxidoreductase [Rhodopila sp.]|jgi:alkanesulfonate monooxygenase SsuD/methylene tetrahydromethanopterin reductase-like flavin-dependent oxidoreductase (luciferase family)|uniref:LLM class flavin-dependent oxidoreductase n=1 Tax=Rhodopila sp. TaxID=2480087 RepID=UPI002C82E007|nr:LLM class flavin-dependent oxidoreductase [Rhodopila sp.]HVZ06298.1 LLM class flavin-dependent oxidoreductase [Rhodopila sp.]